MSQSTKIYRSRSQLLTSYCPGTFFAFEGGTGSYKIHAAGVPLAEISRETERQIIERIEEAAKSWLDRTRLLRDANSDQPVPPELCVDQFLLNLERNDIRPDLRSKLALVTPKLMDYLPDPLTMVCSPCNLVRSYKDLRAMHSELNALRGERCLHPIERACGIQRGQTFPCSWRQLDVLFIHPSGTAIGAMPNRYNWSFANEKVVLSQYKCICGCTQALLKKETSHIGQWYFACAKCGNTDKRWLQNDPDTMKHLKEQSPNRIKEVRMEPDSFRATRVTYPQTDRIIDFSGLNILKLIGDTHELKKTLAERFDYPMQSLSMQEIEDCVGAYPEEVEPLKDYKENLDFIEKNKDKENMAAPVRTLQQTCSDTYKRWVEKGYIPSNYDIPEGINTALQTRENVPSKFDPFRLFAEHLSLEEEILKGGDMGGGKRYFVPFEAPDEDLAHEPLRGREHEIRHLFNQMGVETMGLIRRFKLCFFSYGYTRRYPRPILRRNEFAAPVRLNLFERIHVHEARKHPVYVLKQENEAIYVRLNEEAVRSYVLNLGCANWESFQSGPMGSRILENMFPMDMYLDNIQNTTQRPSPYLAVYALLHTMAHHIIHAVSEYSGLDLGSLGEYIFPTDLAFVVYRNGMTMDLGNLSAMWRNQGWYFLRHLLQPKSLSCGLGMLCDNRGGACPDCIMVPEVTCIAQNRLLSRSILKGGPKPLEGGFTEDIDGFFNIVEGTARTNAA